MKSKSEWVDFRKVKERVSMEDILGHYGLLKGLKRKENELVGFCPIHDGKHQLRYILMTKSKQSQSGILNKTNYRPTNEVHPTYIYSP